MMQVMLVVEGAGESGAMHVPGWDGLTASSVAADRGDVAPTDLVVSVNLRSVQGCMQTCAAATYSLLLQCMHTLGSLGSSS